MPKQPSKAELFSILQKKLETEKAKGKSGEECLEILTEKQYDFMCDYNGDYIDSFLSNSTSATSVGEKRQRRLSPNGYNKIYPQEKMDLFNSICEFLNEKGATIIPKEKENYRDLDFDLNGKHYKIVLSNPRK